MRTITIKKQSNTGNIHDIASDKFDREIVFGNGCKYAVVLSSYYGGKGYTTHRTTEAVIKQCKKLSDYSYQVIDYDGYQYDVDLFNEHLARR